jgi:hypothetical protein
LREIDREERDNIDYATHLLRVPQLFRPTINSEHTRWLWAPWGMWPEPLHPGAAATLERVEDRIEELLGNIEYAGGEGVAMDAVPVCKAWKDRRWGAALAHDAYDAEWKESQHPRGQPGNAGQFGPGGASGGSKGKSKGKSPKKETKQAEKNTSKKTDKSESKVSLDPKPQSGSDSDKIKRAELHNKVNGHIDDWYDMTREERAEGGVKTIHSVSDHVYSYMGVDKNIVAFEVQKPKQFTVGDRQFEGGGWYNKEANKISISSNLSPDEVAEIISHEAMHAKFNAVTKAHSAEFDRILEIGVGKVMNRDGTIRDEYQKEFPAHTLLPHNWEDTSKLRKDDGITDYSRDWWKAESDNKASAMTAVDETLAEMANLDWQGKLHDSKWFQESTSYRPLYEAIHKIYPLVAKGEDKK